MTGAGLHVLDALVNLARAGAPRVDAKGSFRSKAPPDPRDVTAALVVVSERSDRP